MTGFTNQREKDAARLKREAQRADKRARDRLAALETFEAWMREAYPFLAAACIAAGVPPPPEPPP